MRCILHTANIKELLAGRPVKCCRQEFRLPKDFEGRDILQEFVKKKEARDKYVIFLDTDSMELRMMERGQAWPKKGART